MESITYSAGSFDVAVVGAGHAGIEAALACARMGKRTALFTLTLDAVGNMPCNPAIGGTGKGQLVYEIDALGGEMGAAADAVTLQSRTLNLGKGPAVWSKRVQADRELYRLYMKHTLEKAPNLSLIQAEVVRLVVKGGRIAGIVTATGAIFESRAVVICSGTYLKGRVIIGEHFADGGPDGMQSARSLSDSLSAEGILLMRFKTGTPPRIHRASIDFSVLEVQQGESDPEPYSLRTERSAYRARPNIPCHIVYTNSETHRIIRENLDRSPLYSGKITGVGPRYCPSIEDKVMRFADKERHQLFVEPVGFYTEEMYLQGFSSSMPEEIQRKMLATLPGFEHAQIMRSAYAIEYDCADPTQLSHSLMFKQIEGLFGAGQFNGTSGYEEAAAQGIVAGINAALYLDGREPMILPRDSSYTGTLIDDLTVKGTHEPYRIMTSRSEYRLLLRQDNAGERLAGYGLETGSLPEERYEQFMRRRYEADEEIKRLNHTTVAPSEELNAALEAAGTAPISSGVTLAALLRRPQLSYELLGRFDPSRPELMHGAALSAEIDIKYEGYIDRQKRDALRMRSLENKRLPPDIDYSAIAGLRLEARQKLSAQRPENLGMASRISGVSPADIAALIIFMGGRK